MSIRYLPIILLLLQFASVNSQVLKTFYNQDGNDFIFDATSTFGSPDSLYLVTNSGGPLGWGAFVRWSNDGGNYDIIYSFDEVNNGPVSLVGNDTIIYGTTHQSGTGQLFRYSLLTYEFEFLHEFTSTEAQFPQIKYITDSLLWGFTEMSAEDEGNVFTIDLGGSGFTKIYNNSAESLGRQFGDIHIEDGYLFIACRSGGGIPYDPGDGLTGSGSIIRVDLDGNNYTKLVEGRDGVGTDPRSIFGLDGRLYILFSGSGNEFGGRFGYTSFDGSETDIGLIVEDPIGQPIIHEGIVLINSINELIAFDPLSTGARSILNYETQGWSSPSEITLFDGGVIIPFGGGGLNQFGGLARYTNAIPTLSFSEIVLQEGFTNAELNLLNYLEDDGEIVSIHFEPVSGPSVEMVYDNATMTLNINELDLGYTSGTISATDNGLSKLVTDLSVFVNSPIEMLQDFEDTLVQEGFNDLTFTLEEFFTDRNLEKIAYRATSSNEDAILASVSSGILTISNFAPGTTIITVEADDAREGDISAAFEVINNGNPFGEIENVLVTEGFDVYTIDLDDHFEDPNDDLLTYTSEASDESVIAATVSEGLLTLAEVGFGPSTVTIEVIDGMGGSLISNFDFDINRHPILEETIEVVSVKKGFGNVTLDLSGKFSDPDGDEISFSLENSNAEIIDANIQGEVVSIDELDFGKGSVTLNVMDGRGGAISLVIFDLVLGTIEDFSQFINVYPNPTSSEINISKPAEILKQVRMIDQNGRLIFERRINEIFTVDVSKLPRGIYLVQFLDDKQLEVVTRRILLD